MSQGQESTAQSIDELRAERDHLQRRVHTMEGLIEAGKTLSQELALEDVFRIIVELACELTGARYGALGVLDDSGERLARFITVGIDDETREKIGDLPTGRGILGVLIKDAKALRLTRISDDERSVGFPDHHPPMDSFLGVPIVTRGDVKGRIYLTEKIGSSTFTDEDEWIAMTLASQAAIALETAELYEMATHAASDLAEANVKLEQSGRHKSAFLANMSHELRTPLNSIIGYARLILDDADNLNSEQREDVEIIHTSGTHLLGLINDLLDLSKIEAGKTELSISATDVVQVARDTVNSMRPMIDADAVEIQLDAPETLFVQCDRSRLRQMLLNVVGNAVKFTRQGTITTTVTPRRGGGARFLVRDTGPGIPDQDVQRIFESFFQSEAALARSPREDEGAGLGLAITRMLAELHGGTVTIESNVGLGTEVCIEIPDVPEVPHG